METKLEKVRAKIIEAVPEIVVMKRRKYEVAQGEFNSDDPIYAYRKVKTYRPITLADVLRAIEANWGFEHDPAYSHVVVHSTGVIGIREEPDDAYPFMDETVQWDLALPLDDQEPEVVEFIGSILGV